MNWHKLKDKLGFKRGPEVICFPPADRVFAENAETLQLVFFPLCSVRVAPEGSGPAHWYHFVDRWNNGTADPELFDRFSTRDGLRFTVTEEGYQFEGEPSRFPSFDRLKEWREEALAEFNENAEAYLPVLDHAEAANSNLRQRETARYAVDYDYGLYTSQVISYLITRERFRRTGELQSRSSYSKKAVVPPFPPTDHLGGTPQWEQHDVWPLGVSGNLMRYIGKVTGYHYLMHGSDAIFLFHDEAEKRVQQVFQYG